MLPTNGAMKMRGQVLIVPATSDDIAQMVRRRFSDEHAKRLYRDLAETTTGAFVAKDEGVPIGIVLPHAAEDEKFLCDLYVEPSFREQGIAAALLEAVQSDGDDAARSAVIASNDLSAFAFALRHGATAHAQLLHVSGAIPREDDLLQLVASDYRFGVHEIDITAHGFALDALDRDVRGTARRGDHAYFVQHATGMAFALADEFVGYAYVWPSGRIGPIASVSPAYVGQFFAFALAASARAYSASWCTALIPAQNVRAIRTARRAGLRIGGTATFVSEMPLADLSRYVAFTELLV